MRCDLQIFSGCVCHLEQLHAQSPFLFPIVFSINLIPFFDICSVDYLLFFHPGCSVCAALLGPLRGRNSTRCCRSAKLLVFTIMHSNTRQAVRVDAFGLREMVLGKSRQAHQRTIMHSNTRQALNASTRSVYAKWYWVNHGRLTSEQSCTRTLDRQRTIMHSNTRQALNASTRLVYAKWYWVNHGRLTSERQAHQRTQSLPSATHRHSSITRPCCSSAQAPSFLSFTRRRVRDAPSR